MIRWQQCSHSKFPRCGLKDVCKEDAVLKRQLELAFNSSSVPEVFWQAESSRERLWEHHLPALSKFCCPAQSDKEATGTASSVSSLINRLIRLIQQCFNGEKLSPFGKSPVSLENYIFFPFLSPSGPTYFLCLSLRLKVLLLIAFLTLLKGVVEFISSLCFPLNIFAGSPLDLI